MSDQSSRSTRAEPETKKRGGENKKAKLWVVRFGKGGRGGGPGRLTLKPVAKMLFRKETRIYKEVHLFKETAIGQQRKRHHL